MDKIKIIQRKPFLSSEVRLPMRISYCIGLIAVYILTIFFLIDYLPDKWFADSNKMYSLMEFNTGLDNSFAVTGKIFSLFPLWSHSFIVALVGISVIVLSNKAIVTWRGMILNSVIILPLLLLGLLVPSKETIVFIMTLIVFVLYRHIGNSTVFILALVTLYLSYGMFVRIYYLLILFVWLFLLLSRKLPKPVMFLVMALGISFFFMLPDDVYFQLQSGRDDSYRYSEHIIFSNNRTSFPNPFSPDNPLAFLGNYLYASVILNIPFFLFVSPKEILLFINVLIYGWLTYKGIRQEHIKIRILSLLFLSHVLVLWLFEPDFGSYFRHFSSVFLYLVPAFAFIERGSWVEGAGENSSGKEIKPWHLKNFIIRPVEKAKHH